MEHFGGYVLLERIATGGMAEVFRAASVGSAGFFKQVAIKRIHPHLANDEEVMDMLVREAKLASELEHPNVIRVLDLGSHEGAYFLAMEYVAGQALHNVQARARKRGERLPLEFVLHTVKEALQGLVYAHGRKDHAGRPMEIIHRDISPQNIILSYEGAVQLLDFGIARAADFASQTGAGTLRGKPGYFPPEVFHGAPVTQAFDTYGMGVVLFELLTLRRLRVPREDRTWAQLVNEPVPTLQSLGVTAPTQVSELLTRALANDPKDRFPTAYAFASAVHEVMRDLRSLWSAQDSVAVMARLFAEEIEQESRARARFFSQLTARAEPLPTAPVPPDPIPGGRPASWMEDTQLKVPTAAPDDTAVPRPGAHAMKVAVRAAPIMEVRKPAAVEAPATPSPTPVPKPARRAPRGFKPVLGIDFGTTNTCASYVTRSGNVRVVPVTSVDNVLPTIIWYGAKDRFVVGGGARDKMLSDPESTIVGFKRFLGRRFHSEFVSRNKDRFLYKLVEGPGGFCAVEVHGEVKSLRDLTFHLIQRILELAEADAAQDIEDCVLSVPAHYGYGQRQMIRTAAEMAGLEVRAVVNEPTAAALYYARQQQPRRRALIYDLGGGTFDATLIQVENGVVRVLATGGDAFLGGADFDDRIADAVVQQFQRHHGVDLRAQRVVMQRLKFACEQAKVALSAQENTLIRVPFVAEKDGDPLDVEFPLNRPMMDILIAPLIERTMSACEELLQVAGLAADEIDETIVVGGQTRTPALRRRVFSRFKFDPEKMLHPELTVCSGAAVLGQEMGSASGARLVDVVPVPIWVMVPGSFTEVVINANTAVPCVRRVSLDKRPAGNAPLKLVVFEALESTSVERAVFGRLVLEPEWLRANPGPIQLEFKMTADFELHVTAVGSSGARTALSLEE